MLGIDLGMGAHFNFRDAGANKYARDVLTQ